jgi:hypothetical protein
MNSVRIVYVDATGECTEGASLLRSGEAGFLWIGEDGAFQTDTRVELSFNTTHALLGHGVVDALNELALEGRVGEGVEAILPAAILDSARAVFIDADRTTYGATHEFVLASRSDPDPTEYRIRIHNREYQAALTRLTDLTSSASREGKAVWVRI